MCKKVDNHCREEKMGCKGCAYCDKSADEMFEELEFEKNMTYENVISYEDEKNLIEFWTDREIFTCDGNIDKKTLKAINKKVEELGWE